MLQSIKHLACFTFQAVPVHFGLFWSLLLPKCYLAAGSARAVTASSRATCSRERAMVPAIFP